MGEKIEESTLAPGRGKIGQRRGEEEGENGIGGRNGRNNKSARDGQWIDKTRGKSDKERKQKRGRKRQFSHKVIDLDLP